VYREPARHDDSQNKQSENQPRNNMPKKIKLAFKRGQLARLRVTADKLIQWGVPEHWTNALSGSVIVQVLHDVTPTQGSVRIRPGDWFVDPAHLRPTKCRAITVEVPRG
jgi:hypothetical protein